ncbi:hypothetical protein KHA96_11070 [Bacillus sp. FJAT-49711]|uniref:hypothetical protein n=1 Tax=Bacillus sp. FJAT-49711 TaxID=2833585 RepID=UPI001BCA1703|nr:hypothetical protein [Bacillus sp. FJAT-49711]MBS4218855.1 hypothetical protein [Bacillus sp. FJAT-49711]
MTYRRRGSRNPLVDGAVAGQRKAEAPCPSTYGFRIPRRDKGNGMSPKGRIDVDLS